MTTPGTLFCPFPCSVSAEPRSAIQSAELVPARWAAWIQCSVERVLEAMRDKTQPSTTSEEDCVEETPRCESGLVYTISLASLTRPTSPKP